VRHVHALVIIFTIALAGSFATGCSKKPAPKTTIPPVETRTEPQPAVQAPEVVSQPVVPPKQMRLEDCYFDYDQHNLRADAREVLTRNAEFLRANGDVRVVIEGHCDERGTVEYNLALGDRRARAAKDFLVGYGIEAARIETISYGEERPFAPGHDDAAWSQNRRAHFAAR
jgi:peptidoglycan-associated lipoprotein